MGAQICSKKGRHGVGGIFRKYRLSRGGWQTFFAKGQIVNSPQIRKVCLEGSLGTTWSLLWMYSHVINCFSSVHVTLWTVACQATLSMGFSRQESWSGLLCPPRRDLPDPDTRLLCLLYWQAGSLPLAPPHTPNYSPSKVGNVFPIL